MSHPVRQVDPRSPRFAAAVTAVVLALALVSQSPWLLAVQAALFAVGAFAGVTRTPHAVVYRRLVRPRLGPPAELEDVRPLRFAQQVGLGFAVVGLLGAVVGWTPLFLVATACAFAAAFLNAAFGYCLGCEVYLLGQRVLGRSDAPLEPTPHSAAPDRGLPASGLPATALPDSKEIHA